MLEQEVSMLANLSGAYTHHESDVVLGLVEFPLGDLRIASVLIDMLYLSKRGAHRGQYDHVRLAVFNELADFRSDLAA